MIKKHLHLLGLAFVLAVLIAGSLFGNRFEPIILLCLAILIGSGLWNVFQPYDRPVNRFWLFFRNGILLVCLQASSAFNSSGTAFRAFVYFGEQWLVLGAIGYVIRCLCLAIAHRRNKRLAFSSCVKAAVTMGLVWASTAYGWNNSQAYGYQSGCLNPFLPIALQCAPRSM